MKTFTRFIYLSQRRKIKLIEIKELVKLYNHKKENEYRAIDGISCSIAEGKWTTIVGPSGSGKTTFLKCISGIEKVTSGSIKLFDSELTTMKDKERNALRKNEIAFIFQEYNLIDDLKIIENISLEKDISAEIDTLITHWGMSDILYHFPSECSGGQQQKTAILRSLLKESKILFCDEPTGALDSKSSKDVLKVLKEISKTGDVTIVMVTHNPLIEQMSDFVITIQDGQILEHLENKNPLEIEEIEW